MSTEEWRSTLSLPKDIEVSSEGRIRRYVDGTNAELIEPKVYNGMKWINCKGKSIQVHRLVAEAFIPNPNNCKIVRHKNQDNMDNRAENLEWSTYAGNFKQSVATPSIYCKELNMVFSSLRSASYVTHIVPDMISICIKEGTPFCGLTFISIPKEEAGKYSRYDVIKMDPEEVATLMRSAKSFNEFQDRMEEMMMVK